MFSCPAFSLTFVQSKLLARSRRSVYDTIEQSTPNAFAALCRAVMMMMRNAIPFPVR